MSLDVLFQRADIWRGGETPAAIGTGVATGHASLDALLPASGWPRGALTEVLAPEGHGALSLLMPALAQRHDDDRWLAFVAPPCTPYAPALAAWGVNIAQVICVCPRNEADRLWAVEQCLLSGACAAVLSWFARPPLQSLRRLQLAAESGDCVACLFYPPHTRDQATPAALRIGVVRQTSGISVRILKRRGGWPCGPVNLEFDHAVAGTQSAATAA